MNQNDETTMLSTLIAIFGNPISFEKKSPLYMIYKWESTEDEYGRKFKNKIDKYLNILPYEIKTDFPREQENDFIIDTYRWETPQIFVELKVKFSIYDDQNLSFIVVRIEEK